MKIGVKWYFFEVSNDTDISGQKVSDTDTDT